MRKYTRTKLKENNGTVTKLFLSKIDSRSKNDILSNIANHYGISNSDAYDEITDPGAEHLLDYVTGPERYGTMALMKRYGLYENRNKRNFREEDQVLEVEEVISILKKISGDRGVISVTSFKGGENTLLTLDGNYKVIQSGKLIILKHRNNGYQIEMSLTDVYFRSDNQWDLDVFSKKTNKKMLRIFAN